MSNQIKKIGIFTFIAGLIGCGAYYCYVYEKGPIYTFNPARDTQPILDIFNKNWYWLIANDDSSPAFMLKYRTPNTNPLYFGKMRIKVLQDKGKLAGFVTYYPDGPKQWHLLFMAVDNDFGGKGYGKQLIEYALHDMASQGAQRIWLCTRLANLPAQRIYKDVGFTEFYSTDSGYIYFEYYI